MTPFFWYNVAIVVLITMAGVGLGLLISRIRPTIVICPGAHAPAPGTPQPRPDLEEASWRKPPPARHVKPRLDRVTGDYQLPPAPGSGRAPSAAGGL